MAGGARTLEFGLNHITVPGRSIPQMFELARAIGCQAVEIRNDLTGDATIDASDPETVRAAAQACGVRIVSINALYPFNDFTPEVAARAGALADYAKACGAEALVLVPKNDGTDTGDDVRMDKLEAALAGLLPILETRGLFGLVEPLGFTTSSLRLKSEAVAAIAATPRGGPVFRLVHDTFHHALAGEHEIFPAMTGLVHISGVADPSLPFADMLDAHRVLVDDNDRLDNVGQVAALRDTGYAGVLSFEPFAAEIQGLADPSAALSASMDFIRAGLRRKGT